MTDINTLLQRIDALKAELDQHRDWQRNEVLEALNIEYDVIYTIPDTKMHQVNTFKSFIMK